MVRFAVALSLCLLAWTTMSCAASQGFATAEATGPMPKYESVADPPGVLPTRILVEDGVLHFGSTHDQFKDLLASRAGYGRADIRSYSPMMTRPHSNSTIIRARSKP